jgi:hypothetical protein
LPALALQRRIQEALQVFFLAALVGTATASPGPSWFSRRAVASGSGNFGATTHQQLSRGGADAAAAAGDDGDAYL